MRAKARLTSQRSQQSLNYSTNTSQSRHKLKTATRASPRVAIGGRPMRKPNPLQKYGLVKPLQGTCNFEDTDSESNSSIRGASRSVKRGNRSQRSLSRGNSTPKLKERSRLGLASAKSSARRAGDLTRVESRSRFARATAPKKPVGKPQQLWKHCAAGDLKSVKALIDREVSNRDKSQLLSSMDRDRQNCLHFAVQSGERELIEFLTRMKVPALASRSKGQTPLHAACRLNLPEVAQLLVESGCSPNQPDV